MRAVLVLAAPECVMLVDTLVAVTEGTMFVLKAGAAFDVVSRNKLEEECYTSPAISGGQLFIRTLQHLYCIGAGRRNPGAH